MQAVGKTYTVVEQQVVLVELEEAVLVEYIVVEEECTDFEEDIGIVEELVGYTMDKISLKYHLS